ncbi:MAG TPA: helix-turn-helix domain-containing protein [Longimicrobiales bacterium]
MTFRLPEGTAAMTTEQPLTVWRVTTAEAARLFNVPERTIRRWHAEGRLPEPARRGRAYLWDVLAVARAVEERRERKAG